MTIRIVLAAAMLAAAPLAAAADKPQIGYVDMQKVVNESKSGKQARAGLEQLVKQKNEQIARDEKKLKDQIAAFEKEQLAMSEAQKAQKRKELEEKFEAFQKTRAEAQRELNRLESDFLRKAMPELRGIVSAIAREEKLLLVFDKHEVPALYAEDGPDLTARVLQAFDAKTGK